VSDVLEEVKQLTARNEKLCRDLATQDERIAALELELERKRRNRQSDNS
jgi:hypothetical protein